MTIHVQRHPSRDAATCRRYLDRELRLVATVSARLDQSPGELRKLFDAGLRIADFASVLDPDSDELCRGLRLAEEAALGLVLQGASTPPTTVAVRIDGRERALPATGPQEFGHAGHWQTAFHLALVLRDRDALDRLCAVPGETLRRSTTRVFEYDLRIVEALRALWLRRPDVGQRLVEALEEADPAREPRAADAILFTVVPSLKMLAALLAKDPSGFQSALVEALELHRELWSRPDRAADPDGYLAWQCLAHASLGYAEGFPVVVESGYLPARVIRGGCCADGSPA